MLNAKTQLLNGLHSQSTPAVTIELLNKVKDMLRKQYKTRFVIKVGEHLKSIAVEDILFFAF